MHLFIYSSNQLTKKPTNKYVLSTFRARLSLCPGDMLMSQMEKTRSHKAYLLVQRLSKETNKQTLGLHLAARAGKAMKWVMGWRRLGYIQVAAASDGVTWDGLSSFRVVGMGIRPGACWQQVNGSSPVTNSAVIGPYSSLYVFVS